MNNNTYDSDFTDEELDEDDNSERLSIDDAALIWASNGMDEDYTFGYTEDDLLNELNG